MKLSTFKCNKVISLICNSLLCGGCELATIIVGVGVSVKMNVCVGGVGASRRKWDKKFDSGILRSAPLVRFWHLPLWKKIVLLYKIWLLTYFFKMQCNKWRIIPSFCKSEAPNFCLEIHLYNTNTYFGKIPQFSQICKKTHHLNIFVTTMS